mmetsp:Transcript_11558/g.17441  ORF Transcript_11558/g.17441 Transcript_11558/m.17441 type:complete len:119 (-) Transcript_11558:431-787(-)
MSDYGYLSISKWESYTGSIPNYFDAAKCDTLGSSEECKNFNGKAQGTAKCGHIWKQNSRSRDNNYEVHKACVPSGFCSDWTGGYTADGEYERMEVMCEETKLSDYATYSEENLINYFE